jgi:hypothetical protein
MTLQAFHRLQIDGVVIIDDFFGDNTSATSTSGASHSKPLFTCPPGQSTYISQAKRSRDVVYDGVVRSDRTAGYDTIHGKQDPKTKTKHIKGPVVFTILFHELACYLCVAISFMLEAFPGSRAVT